MEAEEALFQKRILVVNKQTGKDRGLEGIIHKGGFQQPVHFLTLPEAMQSLDTNAYDVLILDNRDGQLTELESIDLIGKYPKAFTFVCLTVQNWSDENYKTYGQMVKFVKDPSYLKDVILNALKA